MYDTSGVISQPLEVSILKRRFHYGPPWRILFILICGMVAAALVAFLSGVLGTVPNHPRMVGEVPRPP